jgi:hypothetical protein
MRWSMSWVSWRYPSVVGVLGGPSHASDLRPHLLGNGETGRIIAGTVDPHAGCELLYVLVDGPVVELVDAVGEDCTDVVVNDHLFLLEVVV